MIIHTADPKEYQELRNQYEQLPALKKTILRIFSIVYKPISRTDLVTCLQNLGLTDSKGNQLLPATLKPTLDKLLASGLVVYEQGKGVTCHAKLREIPSRDAIKAGEFEKLVTAVETTWSIEDVRYGGWRDFRNNNDFIREVRIGIHRGDLKFIHKQFEDFYRFTSAYHGFPITLDGILIEMIDNPFDQEWFNQLKPELRDLVLETKLIASLEDLSPIDELFEELKKEVLHNKRNSLTLAMLLAEQFLFRGQLTDIEKLLKQLETQCPDLHPSNFFLYQANVACLRGQYPDAIADYRKALTSLRKLTKKRKVYLPRISGILFIFALLGVGTGECYQEAESYIKIALDLKEEPVVCEIYKLLQDLIRWQQGDRGKQQSLRSRCQYSDDDHALVSFFKVICLYWLAPERKGPLINQAKAVQRPALKAGYQWLAAEMTDVIEHSQSSANSADAAIAEEWRNQESVFSLLDILQPKSDWELSLAALASLGDLAGVKKAESTQPASKRLAWFVTYYSTDNFSIAPKEQVWNPKSSWSAGRAIALKRLTKQSANLNYFTPQDWQVCAHLDSYSVGYYGQTEYRFEPSALVALIGHPLVFWENTTVQVEVVAGEPQLQVKKTKNQRLILQLEPDISNAEKIIAIKESLTRLKVIEVNDQHLRIATILGNNNRLEVPVAAQEKVLTAINAIAGLVTVHSDIGGGLESAQELPAQSLPHIQLLPMGDGLKVALLTRPFGEAGPYFQPGKGGETVITDINGQRYQTTRDLNDEKQQADEIIKACPTLILNDAMGGEWLLEDPENCLELLLELQALGEKAKIEWPEGEKLRVSHQARFNQLQLHIQRERDWFSADGELRLDDNLVFSLQQLMELLGQSSSRFIALGDGQFLALTEEFRQRLEELKGFSEKQGKGRRFHPLAALALEDLFDEAENLKSDRHWKSHLKRIKEMQSLEPQVPSTLQADLRDYQVEGFQWLARLAHWGVGACLADDMGLGKTIQALALILTKASAGPTLIIAPTSVCPNWINEAARFAPTLKPQQFGSGDRATLLENLQPFDLIVCTYGLLQQEEVGEMLAKVQWQVVVLDEAQAIKNMTTKRSQAAMNLQAEFKLITTGTPIENHLGELWNLFRFINPGLLGSLDSFNERFAIPIERYQDKAARQQLKRLIQPFLLRRTKNQVLQELPARTEILLQVELSPEEMAFYEALRRQAIANIEASDAQAGNKHLQVLAEIMRLRRACCNPSLIMPDTSIQSSKLETFGEVLQELLENRHKALVFSQFVDHLSIIRNYLDENKISYQYLDGSTPLKDRKKRVDAFQNGEGDVFLISLKAGGTGLNLTAADYVIHMDPWWNPAVEDQASDRAHRIGQTRPVTIYRLVAKHTIEEKIVDLHHQKRDLADSLLEGTDMSGKVSTEQLLQLIGAG
ncbi:MAG: DEAD/DEAH box helicase [Snowella sp.]|nr:DEAD/DEAH box helicase [Snowella sp.]